MKRFTYLSYYLTAQLLDVLSTYVAIRYFNFQEQNLVPRMSMIMFGLPLTLLFKLAVVLLLAWWLIAKTRRPVHVCALVGGGLITWLAVLLNVFGVIYHTRLWLI